MTRREKTSPPFLFFSFFLIYGGQRGRTVYCVVAIKRKDLETRERDNEKRRVWLVKVTFQMVPFFWRFSNALQRKTGYFTYFFLPPRATHCECAFNVKMSVICWKKMKVFILFYFISLTYYKLKYRLDSLVIVLLYLNFIWSKDREQGGERRSDIYNDPKNSFSRLDGWPDM